MKHIRTFENYRVKKNRQEIIKEAVLQVNDIYKVKTMIDVPQSLINAYVKKVKDTVGKNLRQFFGDVDIAEEIVKYININNLNVDNIPGGALMGGQVQSQSQVQMGDETQAQVQTDFEMQSQTQAQPQSQAQPQDQPQVQIQGQGQTQGQTQVQSQSQEEVQFEEPQTQIQTQSQAQPQAEGEETEGEETEGEETEGEEELPI